MPARACRGCLATDVRLYNIYKNNLYEPFGEVVGNPIFESDELPQHICAMCNAKLMKYVSFRNQVRQVQDYLEDLPLKGIKPTTAYIKTIDRKKHGLLQDLEIFTPPTSNVDFEEIIIYPLPEELPEQSPVLDEQSPALDEESPDLDEQAPVLDEQAPESEQAPDIDQTKPEDTGLDTSEPPGIDDDSIEDPWDLPPPPKKQQNAQKIYPEIPIDVESYKEFNMDVVILTKEQQIEEENEKIRQALSDMSTNHFYSYCLECGKRCKTKEGLDKHFKEFHEESVGDQCEICHCRFPYSKMVYHLATHRLKLVCRDCGFTTNTRGTAINHARSHGILPCKMASCPHCDEEFKKSDLRNHLQENHADKMLWCKFCGETNLFNRGMLIHLHQLHYNLLQSEHKCEKCETPFATKEALEKHLSLTCEDYNCVVCGMHFETKAFLREHVGGQHGRSKSIQLELCPGCGVKFYGEEALQKHQTGEYCGSDGGKHPCVECGEGFPDINTLANHKSDFHQILLRACETCDKVFDPENYRHHMLKIHNIKPESYRFRSVIPRAKTKVWSVRGSIITSSETGAGMSASEDAARMRYMCHVCGKGLAKQTYLTRHMRTHSEDSSRYKCDQCPKSFSNRYHLQNHMTIHTGTKSHKCDFCPKTFRLLFQKRKHVKSHLDLRPHICHMCGKRFRTSTCIKTHIMNVHLNLNLPAMRKSALERRRLEQGIVENSQGHMENSQGHMEDSQDHIEDSQGHMEDSQDDMEDSQGHMEDSQGHIEDSQVHMENSQVHMENTPGRMDCQDETRTDKVMESHEEIAPAGYIHKETGFRIYPVRPKKRKDIQPKKGRVKKIRNDLDTLIKAAEESQADIQNISPGRPIRKQLQIIDTIEEDYAEVPRVIKTIHIKKRRRVNPAQSYSEKNTQYVDTHTTYADTQPQDYMETNAETNIDTDYINTHTQFDDQIEYMDDSNIGTVFNTLSNDPSSQVVRKKSTKKVRKSKGKSMPTLDFDSTHTEFKDEDDTGVNSSFQINEYIDIKTPIIRNQSPSNKQILSSETTNQHVSFGKQTVLGRKDIGLGEKKYVILASNPAKNRTVSSVSKSGKTGWH